MEYDVSDCHKNILLRESGIHCFSMLEFFTAMRPKNLALGGGGGMRQNGNRVLTVI